MMRCLALCVFAVVVTACNGVESSADSSEGQALSADTASGGAEQAGDDGSGGKYAEGGAEQVGDGPCGGGEKPPGELGSGGWEEMPGEPPPPPPPCAEDVKACFDAAIAQCGETPDDTCKEIFGKCEELAAGCLPPPPPDGGELPPPPPPDGELPPPPAE